ncbi:MAG TPA: MFS transporter [Thermodesulfovibrionales bacterium]|nr:MFS transporter [Thermodesulfovibrionales bacterium]
MEERRIFGVGKNVFITGLVSLFMDMSSEMIYPLVPLFLANVLGINKSVIGLIEGIAESTASLLRVFSGWFSDLVGRRKGFMALGYGISTLSRPLIAVATGWHTILGARFIDRFGKGIRTAPRDAIIAESTPGEFLGRAYSFQRSMDTLGAVIGPALAFFFLTVFSNDYRKVFWLSMVPGVIAVLLILFFISERRKRGPARAERPKLSFKHFDRRFTFFVLIAALFALGNSSDVFLILRAQQTGIRTAMIPVLYLTFNVIYSVTAVPAGMAADRFGKKRIILAGFILFTLVYLGFSIARGRGAIWGLFCLYGVFMGLTDGTQKAFLATIIPPDFKATAFGVYHTATGLAMFPASFIGGWLWDHVSPGATFFYGAVTAALSSVLFLIFMISAKRAASEPKRS